MFNLIDKEIRLLKELVVIEEEIFEKLEENIFLKKFRGNNLYVMGLLM